ENKITANKSLLAAVCPYLKRLLFQCPTSEMPSVIPLDDTTTSAFQEFILFIKKYECDFNTEADILNLLKLAHRFQFKQLFKFLSQEIELQNHNIPFCVDLFDFLSSIGNDGWKEKCLSFFDEIFKNGVNVDTFASFSRTLIDELTCRNSFIIKEIDLFHCLIKWTEVNNAKSQAALFSNLRLNLISIEDFYRIVLPFNVIESSDYLNAIDKKLFDERITINERHTEQDNCKTDDSNGEDSDSDNSDDDFNYSYNSDEEYDVFISDECMSDNVSE
ncbi:BTB/POZ domain-containing protein 9-like protein, partial [Leptotrombidium deliense]